MLSINDFRWKRKLKRKLRYTGAIVIKLRSDDSQDFDRSLIDVVLKNKFIPLFDYLKTNNFESYPLVSSIPRRVINTLFKYSIFEPKHEDRRHSSIHLYWKIQVLDRSTKAFTKSDIRYLFKIFKELSHFNKIDISYLDLVPGVPAADPLTSDQIYLDDSPHGVGAEWAYYEGYSAKDIGLIDVENSWNTSHEDLGFASLSVSAYSYTERNPHIIIGENQNGSSSDHGTNVLGVTSAIGDNGKGIRGIASEVRSIRLSSFYQGSDIAENVPEAIEFSALHALPGDILLIECAYDEFADYPVELYTADQEAIIDVVNQGLVVIEAAGNGNNSLDHLPFKTSVHERRLRRSSSYFVDTGAIVVGASKSVPVLKNRVHVYNRKNSSNFGSRVDCFAHGENVVTTGSGDLSSGPTPDSYYTSNFRNTSSAAAIIAGVALVVQNTYKEHYDETLNSFEMRSILSHEAFGIEQNPNEIKRIGVMPDLRKILPNIDVLKDFVEGKTVELVDDLII